MLHQPINLGNVEEWKALAVSDPRGAALLAILLCSFLLVIVGRAELYWDELLLMILSTWLAFSHTRLLFVFGILVAPTFSRQLSASWDEYSIEKDHIWPNAVMIAASLLIAVLTFPSARGLEQQVEDLSPVKAVRFIKTSHLSGPMLNDYPFGGYLIWAAPEYPVFMDGRADVYEWAGVLGEFGNWATLQSDPNALLQKYNVGFCLLSNHSPMLHVLPLLNGWRQVYSDNNSVIFARTP
jgi:hypothetical protein